MLCGVQTTMLCLVLLVLLADRSTHVTSFMHKWEANDAVTLEGKSQILSSPI